MRVMGFYTKDGVTRPITAPEGNNTQEKLAESGKTYVMNSPLLTSEGLFRYRRITQEEAKQTIANGFISAIGHDSTSKFASAIFSTEIPMNRIMVKMEPGDKAIVIKPNGRLPEGKLLTLEELMAIPYEIGLIERIE